MTLVIRWWEHTTVYEYGIPHEVEIHGDTAAECMAQYRQLSDNHDLAKNTPTQIVEVRD